MHDTLNGLAIVHNNHNLIGGIQSTIIGSTTVAGTEAIKHIDVAQVSWLTSHAIGALTVGDCISISAALYVLTGFWRFYLDMKDRYNERRPKADRRKK